MSLSNITGIYIEFFFDSDKYLFNPDSDLFLTAEPFLADIELVYLNYRRDIEFPIDF